VVCAATSRKIMCRKSHMFGIQIKRMNTSSQTSLAHTYVARTFAFPMPCLLLSAPKLTMPKPWRMRSDLSKPIQEVYHVFGTEMKRCTHLESKHTMHFRPSVTMVSSPETEPRLENGSKSPLRRQYVFFLYSKALSQVLYGL
jgi:hypothetical protein